MNKTTHVRIKEETKLKLQLISAKLNSETASTLETVVDEWLKYKEYVVTVGDNDDQQAGN